MNQLIFGLWLVLKIKLDLTLIYNVSVTIALLISKYIQTWKRYAVTHVPTKLRREKEGTKQGSN